MVGNVLKSYFFINFFFMNTLYAYYVLTLMLIFLSGFHKLDAVNVLVHAVNSMLMLIDLCIVSHPTRLLHFYWPLTFALSYVMFSAVYFIAGGTDRYISCRVISLAINCSNIILTFERMTIKIKNL